jgi:hypothetical protein
MKQNEGACSAGFPVAAVRSAFGFNCIYGRPRNEPTPSQRFNSIAEYFEGRQEGNSEQSTGHTPEVGPKKKSQQDGDRVQD